MSYRDNILKIRIQQQEILIELARMSLKSIEEILRAIQGSSLSLEQIRTYYMQHGEFPK